MVSICGNILDFEHISANENIIYIYYNNIVTDMCMVNADFVFKSTQVEHSVEFENDDHL